MPKLILDLDATVFITQIDLNQIHPSHISYREPLTAYLNKQALRQLNPHAKNSVIENASRQTIHIINYEHLSDLINKACHDYDGVIFFTSGCWDDSIREILAQYLDLTPKAKTMVEWALFIAPHHCQSLFPRRELLDVIKFNKGYRWKQLVRHNLNMRKDSYVLVDDNLSHLSSFRSVRNVKTVHAYTYINDKTFYDKALNALEDLYQQKIKAKNQLKQLTHIKMPVIRKFFKPGILIHDFKEQESSKEWNHSVTNY